MIQLALVYLVVVAALSVATFVTYGLDKRRARQGGRRVSEKTLHMLGLCGGWPGALAGQRVFRHKTQKFTFRVVFWLCVCAHLAIIGGLFYVARSTFEV